MDGYIDTEVAAIKAQTDLIPASPASVGDVPTAVDNALAVWVSAERSLTTFGSLVADVWANITRTLTSGGGGSGGATPAEIWAYTPRTLTQSVASGGDLTVIRAVTFSVMLTGLSIPTTWSKIYFTVKSSPGSTDGSALVQIVESNPAAAGDGLLVLSKAPATVAAWATLIVGAGTVGIVITDDATAQLMQSNGNRYDVKALLSDGSSTLLATGALAVNATPTEAIA